jgi:hypothetical protein
MTMQPRILLVLMLISVAVWACAVAVILAAVER